VLIDEDPDRAAPRAAKPVGHGASAELHVPQPALRLARRLNEEGPDRICCRGGFRSTGSG
jgi:hypothetical protein